MRFIYGKQDWKTKERGQENCCLLTNGLGGFSSCTMIGSNTRNDHALLMAAVKAPNCRMNMIHRLEEFLEQEGAEERIYLSTQDYVDQRQEDGYRFLDAFSFEDVPEWRFTVKGVEIKKQAAMEQGKNTVAVRYSVDNRSEKAVRLCITPHLQFVPKGQQLSEEQEFQVTADAIRSAGYTVYFRTDGTVEQLPDTFVEGLYYAYDDCDGRCEIGNTRVNHRIVKQVPAGTKSSLFLVYSMERTQTGAEEILRGAAARRNALVQRAGLQEPIAQVLVKSADQFISHRDSTGGKTILAGYPFFEDWGRDTMIALTGCCISTRQFETAKSILRTFASYCRNGLMPNLFPEGGSQPLYNTADAALLFIYAVYQYYQYTKELPFVREMWPVMQEIVEHYRQGTDFHIHMEEDGLIAAGAGFDQVTWMDVRVGEILPTPRHGKPVEINAYWYNALRSMSVFGNELQEDVQEYEALAALVQQSFCRKFWNEETGCLRDVLSGTKADDQIRCNQIWAVSLPFTMLDPRRERQVVDTVFEKLYTPYGLRTLSMEDAEFQGSYGGPQLKRDLAYHQGTVWTFPLGAFYLAYLKVHEGSPSARETVREQLQVLECALREGCVGQLPEIYDGENPTSSRGCFAQAWSVGEMLHVFAKLEEMEKEDL